MKALMKRMSKFMLAYLPSKEVADYIQNLVESVGPKFGENLLIEKPIPTHITLKSPFYMYDTAKLEEVLQSFAKKQKVVDFKLNGFGNFRQKVVFSDVDFPEEARGIQSSLLEEVKIFPEMVLDDFDVKHNPHFTIAYGNTPESFDKIWEYLQILPVPKYDLKFDNITLLKKVNNLWEVYKTFKINNGGLESED